jgi:hypothetical protein
MPAPCGWTVTGCACGDTCWTAHSASTILYAEATATFLMWAATGRRYGMCDVIVDVCARKPADQTYVTYAVGDSQNSGPYIDGGIWHNSCSPGSCACSGNCEIALQGPTTTAQITSVTISGVVLAPAAYVVYDGHLLTRIDGSCWPTTCHDYSDPNTSFIVEYQRGEIIPAHVQQATNRLACELAKACAGGECALPNRVKSISRQGVDIQMVDLTDEMGNIRTGIPAVDQVIVAENPHGLMGRPTVMSPDLPAPRYVT